MPRPRSYYLGVMEGAGLTTRGSIKQAIKIIKPPYRGEGSGRPGVLCTQPRGQGSVPPWPSE